METDLTIDEQEANEELVLMSTDPQEQAENWLLYSKVEGEAERAYLHQ